MKISEQDQFNALVYSTVAMVISFTAWSVIAPIASSIQDMYSLSEWQKSLLVVTPVLLGSLMRIPMGILADRYGGRKTYAVIMLVLVIPMLGAGFVHSYQLLLVWMFFIGMAGTTFTIAITYVTKWFPPDKQGLVLGVTGMGNLGTAVSSVAVPFIYGSLGLSWVFWILATLLAIMTIIFWMNTKEFVVEQEQKTLTRSLAVIKYPKTWILSLLYFLTFGGFVAFSLYLPTILQESFNFSAVQSGWRISGFVVIATMIRPLGGYLADKLNPITVLISFMFGILFVALVMAFSGSNFLLFSSSCLLMAGLLGAGNGAVFKLVPGVSPHETGAVTGIVSAIGGIGGFFPPIILGMIKGWTGSYQWGFVLLAIFTAICLMMLQFSFWDRQKN